MALVPADSLSPARRLSTFTRLRRERTRTTMRTVRGPVGGQSAARRAITAAAQTVALATRSEARRMRAIRQNWQLTALTYGDTIPEVSFAYRFLANCSARMRVFPGVLNPADPDGPPIPLAQAAEEIPNFPAAVTQAALAAMDALGVGALPKSQIMEDLSYGLGIPGECWLVGMPTPTDDTRDSWQIRSIDELIVDDDGYRLREVPMDPQGQMGWIPLNPESTFVARIWKPHYRFKIMADSPMRALLDVCEELALLGRDVRAIARSRLSSGLLK